MIEVSTDDFADGFLDYSRGEVLAVDVGGSVPLPVKVSPSPGSKFMVVSFHGAVNREKRPYPHFLNFRDGVGGTAHQVSLADATLGLDEKLAIGWYAGAPGLLLQQLLPPFFDKLKNALGVERVVFMGSSGGGFAALFYSWHCQGSVAVVQVPQTNVWKYHLPGALRRYQNTCWPDGIPLDAGSPVLDLSSLYSETSRNSVVYIQSALDFHHLHDQMIPFLASMPVESRESVVVKSSYWGRTGHSNVVPMREWDGWVKAALTAENLSSEAIVSAYESLGIERTPKIGKASPEVSRVSGSRPNNGSAKPLLSEQDTDWAALVADAQLLSCTGLVPQSLEHRCGVFGNPGLSGQLLIADTDRDFA